ncbi:hypothetical protein GCM10009801_48020 [Streptomyces albiaxialis]|uniref:Uncharacterized protein n=1 Tax=Streptomyces albiaxialis TaxID=329523 RepID=A0ABP5HU53_9ACTN
MSADVVYVDLDAFRGERVRQCADVLYGTGRHDAVALLRRYPGCLCVTLRGPGGVCTAVTRGGERARVATGARELSAGEHALLAALLHAWLVRGLPLDTFGDFVDRRLTPGRTARASAAPGAAPPSPCPGDSAGRRG